MKMFRISALALIVAAFPTFALAQRTVAPLAGSANSAAFTGQGMIGDGFGGFDLRTERCGVANGADVEGPYLLWVLTATGASTAHITFNTSELSETFPMTKFGNGTFKYVSPWLPPSTLPDSVTATYDGRPRNAQLVISHGCRPFVKGASAWCSPGFWHKATPASWALTGFAKTALFNSTVYDGFYGATLDADPTLNVDPTLDIVLTTDAHDKGTYKRRGVSGTDPRTHAPNPALNPYNATGAFLTDHIPGYQFDPAVVGQSDACPLDHHGTFKTPQ